VEVKVLRRDFLLATTALMGDAGLTLASPQSIAGARPQAGKATTASEVIKVVPTPKFMNLPSAPVEVVRGGSIAIILGPGNNEHQEKAKLAADVLRRDLQRLDGSLKVEILADGRTGSAGHEIHLWDYEADARPNAALDPGDQRVLADRGHYGQGYVLRTPDTRSLWVIGSTDEGVLLGAMSLLQLMQKTGDGVRLAGAHIRDYPDFKYRAAGNWVLNGEGDRWGFDWGQGVDGFLQVCKRQLDEALRFKINMVVFDGFGWGLKERFPAYGELMRSLNRYARARGIYLVFGGYGAGYGITYQAGPLYETVRYLGHVFKNRRSYPDGPTYECMGFPNARVRNGVDTRTMGGCRGNDELNRLKGDELRAFVQAVEPGALYIHHEDLGSYDPTEQSWLDRCSLYCKKRWPNDSLKAPDGGAGGLAHGYSALVRAINSVHNDDGYDASRDCLIILVSPVYDADSRSPSDWSNVLELWKNIGLQLPRTNNLLVCFREIFPRPNGGQQWIRAFNSTMKEAGLNIGTYVFFNGGVANYTTNYPESGAPTMNALFRGATGMYNFSGDFYGLPMEVVNAEYDWTTKPSDSVFREPATYSQARAMWLRFVFAKDEPGGLFGDGGLYRRACELLYGAKAGDIMMSYYQESRWVPDTFDEATEVRQRPAQCESDYLPMMWDRAYALPEHWRDLAVDSKTWTRDITDPTYRKALSRLKISVQELHRRLARHWTILAELNTVGAKYVDEALEADPRPESIDGLRFLKTSFRVDQPLLNALSMFHRGIEQYHSTSRDKGLPAQNFGSALDEGRKAAELARLAFPDPIDPNGCEVGTLRHSSQLLVQSIGSWLSEQTH
jgi:hypothetical protein